MASIGETRPGEQPATWTGSRVALAVVLLLGVALRLLVATRGENYDMQSYRIVAEIVARGGNVYAETSRYNYGPAWFSLLFIFERIAALFPAPETAFRYCITIFLTTVDLGVFWVLRRKAGALAAGLFLLNPISIIISGYHSQFDNFSLLVGMLAVLVYGDEPTAPVKGRRLAGLALLGISLIIKHILFAFPLWLAVKQKGLLRQIETLLIPYAIFLFGFVPFFGGEGGEGIVRNVLLYGSWSNAFFHRLFVPGFVGQYVSPALVWLLLLIVFAAATRARASFESLLLYSAVLVAASPAITNQYLAIVVPFLSANFNVFFALYSLVGAAHLLVNYDGLHYSLPLFSQAGPQMYYAVLILLLVFGIAYYLGGRQAWALLRRAARAARGAF